MNILLIGNGGREHALAYKIARSSYCQNLFIAPGNPGTEKHGENVPVFATDFEAIRSLVLSRGINMVVVGPEDPLVRGISDFFENDPMLNNVMVIGPSQAGARLEGSKDFAKGFMIRHGIPTARYATFSANDLPGALEYLERQPLPIVLKADGLAAGKGVLICDTLEEAQKELAAMLKGKFGVAGSRVVVEEFLPGIEMSCFALTDGAHYLLLPTAKDYKRIGQNDTGLNTGGMGAVSPVPFATSELMAKIEDRILKPTINGLQEEGITYRGFLYVGLMLVNQDPYVIEYNCRMGDPETQVVIPRIKTDLVELFMAVGNGTLHERTVDVLPQQAITVVLASGGYPESFEKGKLIDGLQRTTDCLVFQAGTRRRANGDLETNGGRVLAVTAFDRNLKAAKKNALRNADLIHFEGKYFRRDIGDDVLSA